MFRFRPENLRLRLRQMPMLRALPPLAAGILLADGFALPLGYLVAAFLLCGAAALLTDGLPGDLSIAGAILLFGMTICTLDQKPPPPTNTPGEYEFVVRERLSARTGRETTGADLRARRDPCSGRWLPCAGKLIVRYDSTIRFAPGDRAVVRTAIRPFTARHGGYGRLMMRRGYAGTIYLTPSQLLAHDTPREGFSPRRTLVSLHEKAVRRLDRLALPPDEQALCNAMTAGDRRSLSPELRTAYARTGTSHLLAVSGLHVGIVFLLANFLLRGLAFLRRGHIIRNGAVVLLVWLYAAATGFPPSVVRAALMFSLLQFALASSSEYTGLNVLAGTAFLMLLFRPDWLFDPSFLLSTIAVGGILIWGIPLCRLLRTGRQWLDLPISALIIGFTASVATAPLIACTFGQLPTIGLLLNPPLLLVAYVIVATGTLWLILPGTAPAPLFSAVAGSAARLQNSLIETAAALPGASFDLRLSAAACWTVYAIFIAATLLAGCIERKKSVSSLPE